MRPEGLVSCTGGLRACAFRGCWAFPALGPTSPSGFPRPGTSRAHLSPQAFLGQAPDGKDRGEACVYTSGFGLFQVGS